MIVDFDVPGHPAPGGSKTAFPLRGGRRFNVVDSCKRAKSWRTVVAVAARTVYLGRPAAGPVHLTIEFRLARPASHHRARDRRLDLRADAPAYHLTRPDATKLLRAAEDALTGILWEDDGQIVETRLLKRWTEHGEGPGVRIVATILSP